MSTQSRTSRWGEAGTSGTMIIALRSPKALAAARRRLRSESEVGTTARASSQPAQDPMAM